MRVAGLPMQYVNAAWERLTGYGRGEAVGKSCRVLQGESTEENAVAHIVSALRERQACTVCISNYRKDGTRFRNALTLHPVCDSEGAYRYVIGLASDADSADANAAASLMLTRKVLPSVYDLSQTPDTMARRTDVATGLVKPAARVPKERVEEGGASGDGGAWSTPVEARAGPTMQSPAA